MYLELRVSDSVETPISVAVVYADIVGARASWDVIGREDPHW